MSSLVKILESGDLGKIQQHCSNQFLSNLYFFEKYYPELFADVQKPPQNYNLLLNEQGVNIVNLLAQNGENPLVFPTNEEGKSLMLEIHKDLAEHPLTNPKWKRIVAGEQVALMETERFPISSNLINEIILFTAQKDGVENLHLPSKFLPALNIFGLGGGIFLQILVEKFDFIAAFLLFEEHLDLFRIACYFIDFPTLFSKCANKAGFLFIGSLLQKKFADTFFLERRITTSVIRLELSFYDTPKIQDVREVIHEIHQKNFRGWGTFEDEMIGIKNKITTLNYPILIEPKRVNAPICVVGAGYSLNHLIPFIKRNKKNMIIFSGGTALKPLLEAGIKPDFQIEIERHNYLHEVLAAAPLGDIPLICATVVSKETKELAKEVYQFERAGSGAALLFQPRFEVLWTAPLVGNAVAALACYLGTDILLCGVDCAYKKGQKKHAKGSYYGEEEEELPSGVFEVAGNFESIVYSDSLFSFSRQNLEEAFENISPKTVLNLGDGAYIKGARPTNPNEFDLRKINKKQEIKNLKSLFKSSATTHFYSKDSKYYLEISQDFLKVIQEFFNAEITGKKELFDQVDLIYTHLSDLKRYGMFVLILFGGTISHFLFALLASALHTPHNDIAPLWKKSRELIGETFYIMLEELSNTLEIEHEFPAFSDQQRAKSSVQKLFKSEFREKE